VKDPHVGLPIAVAGMQLLVEDRHPGAVGRHHHRYIPRFMLTLEAEHVGVKAGRALDIVDANCDVV
jgi:hypothetical protein